MKIICTKEEVAKMLTHCVNNFNDPNRWPACQKCALYDVCEGAYVDSLMAIVEVKEGAQI